MLKKTRVVLAVLMWLGITLLLLDVSGILPAYLGWMAKIQFLPAVLAANVGAVVLVAVLTLVFGRIYCSVICPLGVFQDIVSWITGRFLNSPKWKKARFSYIDNKAIHLMRYSLMFVFVICILLGAGVAVRILAPYSIYGRITVDLLKPIYVDCNNLLADWSVANDNYTFSHMASFQPSGFLITLSILYLVIVGSLAIAMGRIYCNTLCPVGTFLGLLSRRSLFRVQIDHDKCKHCGLCEHACKAHAIDAKNGFIDTTKCIDCFDCLNECHSNALHYGLAKTGANGGGKKEVDGSRRAFVATGAALTAAAAIKAEEKFVDGGFAPIVDKVAFKRETRITPPGSLSIRNMQKKCTGCQLCISACPNEVLRPSTDMMNFLQPEMSYENGYCRPECHACSDVCPAGAILPLGKSHEEKMAHKSSVKIGRAVVLLDNCIANTKGVSCGNCSRHCPSGAIEMVVKDGHRVPAVNDERCIGCGACENLCPVRPFSAIHVEGIEQHHDI